YGREYIAVGSGDCGTDDCPPLITAESPLDMTLFWDARARVATPAQLEPLDVRLEQAAKKAEAVAQKLVADQGRGTVREAVRR
ncbi:hypothetical protein KBZ21_40355, partial [Streptomyces sp. A73]|nr:hypothetical protein [Streptomyces sp. A73]